MHNRLFFFILQLAALLASLLFAASTNADERGPLRIRVLTYNIHHGEGVDGKLDLERIAKVITSVEPDLVSVQEVDQKTERTRKIDQPAELMRLTKMQGAFGGNLRLQGGEYGNLILSRWPIKQQRNHALPSLNQGEPRGALAAEIELPEGRGSFTFIATHFDHRRVEEERLASADILNKLETQGLAILAGDLNATPESETLKRLGKQWQVANDRPLPTIPVAKPARQIDFVLFKPSRAWKVIDTEVIDEAVASDHRPLLATLELTGE